MEVIVMRIPVLGEKIVGMRFFYDCPIISGEDFESDAFFLKYRGKTGVIVGITRVGEKVGVDIKFDGEDTVHKKKNAKHLILLPTPQEEQLADELFEQKQQLSLPKAV